MLAWGCCLPQAKAVFVSSCTRRSQNEARASQLAPDSSFRVRDGTAHAERSWYPLPLGPTVSSLRVLCDGQLVYPPGSHRRLAVMWRQVAKVLNSRFVHRLHVGEDEANGDMKCLAREPGQEWTFVCLV